MPEARPPIVRIFALAALELLCGLIVGYAFLDHKLYPGVSAIPVVIGPVATAVLLGAASILVSPRLLPANRLGFPANLTLPVLFALLVRASVILWVNPQSAAFRAADPLLPALLWTKPLALVALGGLQCLVMTMWIIMRRPGVLNR